MRYIDLIEVDRKTAGELIRSSSDSTICRNSDYGRACGQTFWNTIGRVTVDTTWFLTGFKTLDADTITKQPNAWDYLCIDTPPR